MNLLLSFVTPLFAQAQQGVGTTEIQGMNITSLNELVTLITNVIIVVGIAVVIVMLALGFVKYVTSQGDKTAVESVQKTLTYAVIGAVGLLLVYALRRILLSLIGANANLTTAY